MSEDLRDAAEEIGQCQPFEMLGYLPMKYLDYRHPLTSLPDAINKCMSGESCYIKLKVTSDAGYRQMGAKNLFVVDVTDGEMEATIVPFGNHQMWGNACKEDRWIHLHTKVVVDGRFLKFKSPNLVFASEQNRIVPKYRALNGHKSEEIEGLVDLVLKDPGSIREFTNRIEEKVGATRHHIGKDLGLRDANIEGLIRALHRPKSLRELERATTLARQLNALGSVYESYNKPPPQINRRSEVEFSVDLIKEKLSGLPFTITDDQKRAVWDICKDLHSDIPMERLLSGDVGCGKTLCYTLPLVCAQAMGYKTAVLMPNSVLAGQVAHEIETLYPGTPVRLVLGGQKSDPDLSDNPVLVGTSALTAYLKKIQDSTGVSRQFDVVVVDEQQKMGVAQRDLLVSPHTNVLEATATPIPRTAAMLAYGNMKFSSLDKAPVVKDIKSEITPPSKHRYAMNRLLEIARNEGQVAVVYPLKSRPDGLRAFSADKEEEADAALEKLKSAKATRVKKTLKSKATENQHVTGWQVTFSAPKAKKHHENFESAVLSIPLVEEDPLISAKEARRASVNVEDAWRAWDSKMPGLVGRLHGDMTTADKLAELQKMKDGIYKILITTSVIEIGVTVPNLRGMMVVRSDIFGASTLHQFRGRLARHGGAGEFFMHIDTPLETINPVTAKRLEAVEGCSVGRELARLDMEQRGFGDLGGELGVQAGFLDGIFRGLKVTPADLDALVYKIEAKSRNINSESPSPA